MRGTQVKIMLVNLIMALVKFLALIKTQVTKSSKTSSTNPNKISSTFMREEVLDKSQKLGTDL